jgi:transcriptional regulator with XRE-family HTH domain
MAGKVVNGTARHFGRQVRKERLARRWTLTELAERTGINAGHLSRIEHGTRPPTEALAATMDEVFPERDGWFSEWYEDSQSWSWMHPQFRDWRELEENATHLRLWHPTVIHGLAQAESYARALLSLAPGVTQDQINVRLAARLERQRRIYERDEPPVMQLLVDRAALARLVGSPATMVDQLQRLLELAKLPRVTVQLLPQVGHAATNGELMLADNYAYTEHLAAGGVYDNEGFARLEMIFNSIASECYRASESATMIQESIEQWQAK